MSIADWIRDLTGGPRLTDAEFGEMRYSRSARRWAGKAFFLPIGAIIEVVCPGDTRGPSEGQRGFYRELQFRYADMAPVIQAMLDGHRENPQVERSFSLVGVLLPGSTGGAEWALWFNSAPAGWFYSVAMRGWQPSFIGEER